MKKEFTSLFIRRPIAATLLCFGVSLFGLLAFFFLPVSPLPQVEFPVISVQATLPGASPFIVASSVASPLEQYLGQISGVTEMTSTSKLGSTRINIMFDLTRDPNSAARDVQAALIAARSKLPSNMLKQPSYKIVNPADFPIMIIAITSKVYDRAQMYDVTSSILQQKISQIDGVGQVMVGGGSLPAIRVEANTSLLNSYGLSISDIKNTIQNANSFMPKGQIHTSTHSYEITSNDQLFDQKEYEDLVVSYKNNTPVFLKNVSKVSSFVEDIRNDGALDGNSCVVLIVFKEPNSNIIETNKRIYDSLAYLKASIPSTMDLTVVLDRSESIKESLWEVNKTLLLSILLVALTTYIFLGSFYDSLISSTVLPIALLGTFGIMYLVGFSLNTLTMMALTISTGFIIDDAVVVLENIKSHMEKGMSAFNAALLGAKEVTFTVFSMSLSLIAVFIPILLMPGIVGRLFREFSATLSIAILLSMILSFLLTPVLSSKVLKNVNLKDVKPFKFYTMLYNLHKKVLAWSLRHQVIIILITLASLGLSVVLFILIPKSFFPLQDTGRIMGSIQAEQDMSFDQVQKNFRKFMEMSKDEPSIQHVVGYAGGANAVGNNGLMFFALKPLEERKESVFEVVEHLKKRFKNIAGINVYLIPGQEIMFGARSNNAMYQFTLSSFDMDLLNEWTPKLQEALRFIPGIIDVNSDQMTKGLEILVDIDRKKATYYGLSSQEINTALYNYFGQSQIATLYKPINQYHVVLGALEQDTKSPKILSQLFLTNSAGLKIPLSTIAKISSNQTLLQVTHQAGVASATLSFNLKKGYSLGNIVELIQEKISEIGLPQNYIKANFQGNAKIFQSTTASQSVLILGAILCIYVVLGILYESALHPLTILSTLPTAVIGGLIGLYVMGLDFSIMGLVGLLLLIGIVKKNAIMMIDFAITEQRKHSCPPLVAIH
ncbi:MAG TPA: efflux RND transporter permease subunit, partial [Alphaproteobacteria bacterium]|nr:efflux RND transporter permease subunit [Alphaproteobacteria bacterium]